MPLLLRVGMVWCWVAAVATGVVLALVFAGVLPLIDVEPGESIWAQALHGGLYIGAIEGALTGVIGWGLWRRRWWTRLAMMCFWFMALAGLVVEIARGTAESGCSSLLSILVSMGLAALYLYRKPNVRQYYALLESLQLKGATVESA